jgi:hypothetical protein
MSAIASRDSIVNAPTLQIVHAWSTWVQYSSYDRKNLIGFAGSQIPCTFTEQVCKEPKEKCLLVMESYYSCCAIIIILDVIT